MKADREEKEVLQIELPRDLARRLRDFSREHRIPESLVVERALREYFTMGDLAH